MAGNLAADARFHERVRMAGEAGATGAEAAGGSRTTPVRPRGARKGA